MKKFRRSFFSLFWGKKTLGLFAAGNLILGSGSRSLMHLARDCRLIARVGACHIVQVNTRGGSFANCTTARSLFLRDDRRGEETGLSVALNFRKFLCA